MFVRFLSLSAIAAIVCCTNANAAVDISIADEVLNPSLDGGSFVIQLESDSGVQPLGAFDFNVEFTDFVGNLAGQSVSIDGLTAGLGAGFAFGTTPTPVSVGEGDDIRLFGTFGGTSAVDGLTDFITVDFSLGAPLQSGDFFTAGVFLREPINGEILGVADQAFGNVTGSLGSQVVGVPEPSSLAVLGLVAAGGILRRRRR